MTIIVSILVLGAVVVGVWQALRARGSMVARIVDALIPLTAAALLFTLAARVVQSAVVEWNDAKIAPAVAMAKGYRLYQDPDQGVMTGWIYGPVGAILLLPAALAKSPSTASFIGSGITAIAFLAPVMWLLMRASGGRAVILAVAAFVFFGWRTVISEDLCRCAVIAGPDGPALGLAACACAAIYSRRTLATMMLSSVAAVLCIWTKQTLLPLLIALPAYIAIVEGLRKAGMYAALLAGFGIVISGILIMIFGRDMWFHMVTLPMSHPYAKSEISKLSAWGLGLIDLLIYSLPAIALLMAVPLLEQVSQMPASGGIRAWFARRSWSMLLIVAIAFVPSSLIGFVKIGGYLNNLASTHYFLFLAGLAGLVEVAAGAGESARRIGRILVQPVVGLLAIGLGLYCLFGTPNGLIPSWVWLARPYETRTEAIFAHARAHPGQVYCPWNPLITLLSDDRLYHFEWGLWDRVYAERNPTHEQFMTHIPKDVTQIIYIRRPQSTAIHAAMKSHRRQIELAELRGCLVFTE